MNTNEPPVNSLHHRQIRFDLSVKLAGGELANVEMSKDPTPHEVLKMEYYLARLYGWQEIHGIDFGYQDLKKTWQISLLVNRNLFSDKELLHRFVYYDPERRVKLNGLTEIITVELKKADQALGKGVCGMNLVEQWACFFRYGGDKGKRRLINEILAAEEGIAMAGEAVKGFTKRDLEFFRQISEEKFRLDHQTQLKWAREEAEEKGRKEERKKAREEASREKLEAARELKANGVSPELIAASLKLMPEELAGL